MCGADGFSRSCLSSAAGSSPRVRGRLSTEEVPAYIHGLIPACAGQTGDFSPRRYWLRAHPRVCGADCVSRVWLSVMGGSSPRVRGRPGHELSGCAICGLIPACAGQTGRGSTASSSAAAHPRVCGADHCSTRSRSTLKGSSPRVRGRREYAFINPWFEGLIPACAGQTPAEIASNVGLRAHPRVCGADPPASTRTWVRRGSSPRVRGRPHHGGVKAGARRLIPACAGQTSFAVVGSSYTQGSSPRVRGRPATPATTTSPTGLIPACAGQTWRRVRRCRVRWAHPRVCGADRRVDDPAEE